MVPIRLEDYVRKYTKANSGADRADLIARLKETLRASQDGAGCQCGEPIWVLGSAEVGHGCFTCITGSVDSSQEYEIYDAGSGRHSRVSRESGRRGRIGRDSDEAARSTPQARVEPHPTRADFEDALANEDLPFWLETEGSDATSIRDRPSPGGPTPRDAECSCLPGEAR